MTDNQPPQGRKQCMGPPDLEYILKAGIEIMCQSLPSATMTEDCWFCEVFGCRPLVALALLSMMFAESIVRNASVVHMQWALMFLKVYSKETTMRSMGDGIDKKIYQKWVWHLVSLIAEITGCSKYHMSQILIDCCLSLTYPLLLSRQILWENYLDRDIGNDCLVSVDVTVLQIQEYGRKFDSHKFRSSGL